MEGRCPECNRSYEISDEFLAMGGKAKCPHCLLELMFLPKNVSSRVSPENSDKRFRQPTRVVSGQGQTEEAPEPVELDAHCPSCRRRYKVDQEYLERGGAAKCPHCMENLTIAATNGKTREEKSSKGAAAEPDGELFGNEYPDRTREMHGDELESLLHGNHPALDAEEADIGELEPPAHEKVTGDNFDQGIAAEPGDSVESRSGNLFGLTPTLSLEQATTNDQEAFGQTPTSPKNPSLEIVNRAAQGFDEFSDKAEASQEVVGELFDDQDSEEAAEQGMESQTVSEWGEAPPGASGELEDKPFEGTDGAFSPEPEIGSAHSAESAPGDAQGLFSSLATSDDWTSAAAKWAEGGFRADQMPGFVMEQTGTDPEITPLGAQFKKALEESPEELVEVSDSDILMLETEDAASREAKGLAPMDSTSLPVSPTTSAVAGAKTPMAESRRVVKKQTGVSHLKSPPVLVTGIVVLLIVAGVLCWIFLFRGEDIASIQFPIDKLKVSIINAPAPSEYQTKPEAVEHYGQGNRLAYQGKLEAAIREYEQATRLDLAYPHPYRAMGAAYAALGKSELSAAAYETYLRLAPQGSDVEQVRQIVKSYRSK